MRSLLLALGCWLFLCVNQAVADEIPKVWEFPLSGKPIVVTPDFCEMCKCCDQRSQFFAFYGDDVPREFGTTDFPPVIKRDTVDAWQKLQSKSVEISPEITEEVLSGAGIRGLRDFCELCLCCVETPEALILKHGTGAMSNLQKFRVFVE